MDVKSYFGKEAKKKALEGANEVANAVKSTMGAYGRTVIITYPNKAKKLTKDGYSVAKEITFKDYLKDTGASIIKEVSKGTVDSAGDGTTGSIVLCQYLLEEGNNIINDGANPHDVKRGMAYAVEMLQKRLKEIAIPVIVDDKPNKEHLFNVANVSTNFDKELANAVTDAIMKTGINGTINVEKSNSNTVSVQKSAGMIIPSGYRTPHFVTNGNKMTAEFDNPLILICDFRLNNPATLNPLIEKVVATKRPLLIFCDDIVDECLAYLIVNIQRGALRVCAVAIPSYKNERVLTLEDVAVFTGGTARSLSKADRLEETQLTDLGEAKKVIVENGKTTIIDGFGKPELIIERGVEILNNITLLPEGEEKDFAKGRYGRFEGKVATISVGGSTELDAGERKDRADDAVCSVKSAAEYGIVAGGGATYAKLIETTMDIENHNLDFNLGYGLVIGALNKPLEQLLINAGYSKEKIEKIVGEVKRSGDNEGYNLTTKKIENLVDSGIVDSVKVLLASIENAVGATGNFLTTDCILIPE